MEIVQRWLAVAEQCLHRVKDLGKDLPSQWGDGMEQHQDSWPRLSKGMSRTIWHHAQQWYWDCCLGVASFAQGLAGRQLAGEQWHCVSLVFVFFVSFYFLLTDCYLNTWVSFLFFLILSPIFLPREGVNWCVVLSCLPTNAQHRAWEGTGPLYSHLSKRCVENATLHLRCWAGTEFSWRILTI